MILAPERLKDTTEQLKVVGFEGRPTSACGYALPLVYNSTDQNYFKGAIEDTNILTTMAYTTGEIRELEESGHLTLLQTHVPYVSKAVVLFVHCSFVNVLKHPLPSATEWTKLNDDILITVAPLNAIEAMTDTWGQILLKYLKTELKDVLSKTASAQKVKADRIANLADIALCAADQTRLRQQIYFCYALALEQSAHPTRVDNLYKYFFQPEFKNWSKDSFRKQLEVVRSELVNSKKVKVTLRSSGAQKISKPSVEPPETSAAQHVHAPSYISHLKIAKSVGFEGLDALTFSQPTLPWHHYLKDIGAAEPENKSLVILKSSGKWNEATRKLDGATIRDLVNPKNSTILEELGHPYRRPRRKTKISVQVLISDQEVKY